MDDFLRALLANTLAGLIVAAVVHLLNLK